MIIALIGIFILLWLLIIFSVWMHGFTTGHKEEAEVSAKHLARIVEMCDYPKSKPSPEKLDLRLEEVKVFYKLDGNAICAHREDFINLQESPAGFGATEELALSDLLKEEERRDRNSRMRLQPTNPPLTACDHCKMPVPHLYPFGPSEYCADCFHLANGGHL